MTATELIISGFGREIGKEFDMNIPEEIIVVIIMFYPQFINFEGNTVELTDTEKALITSWFMDVFSLENKSCILSSRLLYDFNKDGKKGNDFYKKCVDSNNTFSIVRSNHDGHVFGCFLSKSLIKKFKTDECREKIADKNAFLCVIRSSLKDRSPELFKVKTSYQHYIDYAYTCDKERGPCFGLSDLRLLNNDRGWSCNDNYGQECCFGGMLYGNTLAGGNNKAEATWGSPDTYNFYVVNMTTFEINIAWNKEEIGR